jgi:hypothetical protein
MFMRRFVRKLGKFQGASPAIAGAAATSSTTSTEVFFPHVDSIEAAFDTATARPVRIAYLIDANSCADGLLD